MANKKLAGDGKTDDTAALQALLDKGGTINIPDGTYMVDCKKNLKVRSDTKIVLSKNAVLKAIPNGEEKHVLLMVQNVNNVSISGGTLQGERKEHKGTAGQGGFGLRISGTNVTVDNVLSKDWWGDGFYVAYASNVKLSNLVSDNNRRQGLSIINVKGLSVTKCVFKNTNGTNPQDGIDIEPDKGDVVQDVTITGCTFTNNVGAGIEVAGKRGVVKNVKANNNKFSGNKNGNIKLWNSNKIVDFINQILGKQTTDINIA